MSTWRGGALITCISTTSGVLTRRPSLPHYLTCLGTFLRPLSTT